jgi:hypothetical protein
MRDSDSNQPRRMSARSNHISEVGSCQLREGSPERLLIRKSTNVTGYRVYGEANLRRRMIKSVTTRLSTTRHPIRLHCSLSPAPLRPGRRSLGEVCLAEISQFFGLPELLLEAHAIVGFEIIDEGGLSRIKSERCAFSSKPFFAFGILVRTCCFD